MYNNIGRDREPHLDTIWKRVIFENSNLQYRL